MAGGLDCFPIAASDNGSSRAASVTFSAVCTHASCVEVRGRSWSRLCVQDEAHATSGSVQELARRKLGSVEVSELKALTEAVSGATPLSKEGTTSLVVLLTLAADVRQSLCTAFRHRSDYFEHVRCAHVGWQYEA